MSINNFFQKDFISIDQIKSKSEIIELFKLAEEMRKKVEKKLIFEPLKGMSVAILFYQPSTRTFSSFVSAAKRLGAYVTAIHGMDSYSSVVKGESLKDTMRSIYQTTAADVIVLRHPDNNSSQIAAEAVEIPIVNAGSGKLEHPTQALLDLYTIYVMLKKMNKLKVTMVGDLLYGRTIKSLAKLLAVSGKQNRLVFVSPPELKAPIELIKHLKKCVKIKETDKLDSHFKDSDVIYMTRVQKEWFVKAGKIEEYERVKDRFILTRHLVSQMPKNSIVMHPLPRVGEIMQEVDADSRAKYFDQMRYGLYLRMALLLKILKKDK
jgi:aspartate carbamoyltransferase